MKCGLGTAVRVLITRLTHTVQVRPRKNLQQGRRECGLRPGQGVTYTRKVAPVLAAAILSRAAGPRSRAEHTVTSASTTWAGDIYRYHLHTHIEARFDSFRRSCLTNTKNAANTRMMRILVETVSGLRGSQMDGSEQL